MRITALLTLGLLFFANMANAQEIKFKKGFVYWDGESVMEYRVENMGREFYLYHLGKTDQEEIVLIMARDNNTEEYKGDDYNKIFFSGQKKSYTVSEEYMFKGQIVKLINKKVINKDGSINEENMDQFIAKFDEELPRDCN